MNDLQADTIESAPEIADHEVPLIFQIIGAARELQTKLDDALDEIGLSCGKLGVLRVLTLAGEPISLSDLAQYNKCVPSNVTQLVDRLEADGLVRRVSDPQDRRVTRAALTHEGRMAWIQAKKVIVQHERELIRTMSEAEAESLARVLGQLNA